MVSLNFKPPELSIISKGNDQQTGCALILVNQFQKGNKSEIS